MSALFIIQFGPVEAGAVCVELEIIEVVCSFCVLLCAHAAVALPNVCTACPHLQAALSSGQLSLLPSAGWEMSSSLWATG